MDEAQIIEEEKQSIREKSKVKETIERIRIGFGLAAMVTLILSVIVSSNLFEIKYGEVASDIAKNILALSTPIITVLGAVIGFLFGSKKQ